MGMGGAIPQVGSLPFLMGVESALGSITVEKRGTGPGVLGGKVWNG